jgi:hypothetical protein
MRVNTIIETRQEKSLKMSLYTNTLHVMLSENECVY